MEEHIFYSILTLMKEQTADIIICGGGLAGLSLAIRLADRSFAHLNIVVIDKSAKNLNDRTWSFWSKPGDNRFSAIYHKTWEKIGFYSDETEIISSIYPYTYNTIKGIDFYTYGLNIIESCPHMTFIQDEILDITELEDIVEVEGKRATYRGGYVYDSLVRKMPEDNHLFVWQHFLGWEVRFDRHVFDDEVATFMDFRIDQAGETRFVYVLPFSQDTALVEATIFSDRIWSESEYEKILVPYVQERFGSDYHILQREQGKIPMTTDTFAQASPRIIPIGTKSATVKPSSGYAFTRIQQESDQLAQQIAQGTHKIIKPSSRYLAYDKTLLNVLLTEKESAAHVFSLMFKRNEVAKNLKFLDEDTSLLEEMKIFSTLPFWPFLKAFTVENVLRGAKIKKIRQS